MWLTGFDSPSMHTMYIDKPMRGAPLMQAIARVNRTFKDKPAGLVVDYLGIAEDLKSALADYTKRDQDHQGLGQDLREQAIPSLVEEHEIVCSILNLSGYPGGRNWRAVETRPICGPSPVPPTGCWVTTQAGPSRRGTKEAPCLKCRFMAHARRIMSLFAVCVPADEKDLLTFPWVGSTASIGHFWAAADAAGRSLTCPLPAQRVHRGSRVKGGRRPSQRDALAPLTREGCTRRRRGPDLHARTATQSRCSEIDPRKRHKSPDEALAIREDVALDRNPNSGARESTGRAGNRQD